ncbi:MAG TPA: hypothetical protein VGC95_08860 [Chitinophagaceae bacterium]
MLKRLNELNFVIGLFFSIVAVVLLTDSLTRKGGHRLTLYTGIAFLIFGLLMIAIRTDRDQKS